MAQTIADQKKRMHPHKFTMWVAIGSILMMFAGLTSAYIVKRSQAGWIMLEIPVVFWYSTIAILLSSLMIHLSLRSLRQRDMKAYRNWLVVTALLGVLFLLLQVVGFKAFGEMDIRLVGAGSNASHSFLLAISGLHGLHVLGGVIALVVMAVRAVYSSTRNYNTVPLEVVSTYWHFVDLLWIYLFIFFNWMR